MARFLALAGCLASYAAALTVHSVAADSDKFWPFTSWSSEEEKKPSLRPAAPVKRLEDTKKVLLATAVFKKKTMNLCNAAADSELHACEAAASERLFCAMFTRHSERFEGMAGLDAQRKSCKEINIMVTSLEAAKDAQALSDASESF
eukprot:CAMPEP_0169352784 /NCGR_PEP_ID=MMETSP1017-20121227/25523_1 /TAXON_ID=342587 /ORGANISM="Karlodinium micrum, Strain CCMP2283" /LENGTH=146 /DNA_ID=CAMNT_0009449187 /DNA_START=89 /DNA_END=529 /DNA_ORIENTATION=+